MYNLSPFAASEAWLLILFFVTIYLNLLSLSWAKNIDKEKQKKRLKTFFIFSQLYNLAWFLVCDDVMVSAELGTSSIISFS